MLFVAAALAAPLQLGPYTDALGPGAADAICLRSAAQPDRPAELTWAAGAVGNQLRVDWVLPDGPTVRAGVGATLTVTWADGRTQLQRIGLGAQVAGTAATARGAVPVVVGAGSGARVATRYTLPLTDRDVPVQSVTLAVRPDTPRLCVLAAEVLDAPVPGLQAVEAPGWYPFAFAGVLDAPPPQALPVEAPAGARGFVSRGPDGHLRFADGTRARFWGVNLVAEPALPPKEEADAYAATLAGWGFNLVRLHHIDGPPPRGVLDPRRKPGASPWLPERVDQLDWFVSKLLARGVYLKLEVATERDIGAGDGVAVPGGMPNGHKLAPMWDEEWLDAYLLGFERLWGRENPYTGRRYADEPGVAMLELSNEHSLLLHWGFGLENLPPAHLARLDARWNAWLAARYPDEAALAAAWAGPQNGGLRPGEALGSVQREPRYPPQFDRWPEARRRDLFRFYQELEMGFYAAVKAKAAELGFRVPLVPSIHYSQPLLMAMYRDFDIADEHWAWDQLRHTAFADQSALAVPTEVLNNAAGAVVGQATMISELNHPWPNRHRAEGPLLWATLASVQDWDALIWFNWADTGFTRDVAALPGSFDLRSTPVTLAQLATASSLFRSGAIAPPSGRWYVENAVEHVERQFYQAEPARHSALRLPWELTDVRFVLSHLIRSSFSGAPQPTVPGAPVPGVGWHPDPGLLVLDQPTVQARIGPRGTPARPAVGPVEPSLLKVRLDGWSAVSFASVDGQPLLTSRRALLAVSTEQVNTGMALGSSGRDLAVSGTGPVLVRPAAGEIEFAFPVAPVVETLDGAGRVSGTVPVRPGRKGWWRVTLDPVTTPLLLVRDAR